MYLRHGSGGLLPAPNSGSDSPLLSASEAAAQADTAKVIDVVADRRRAKALKASAYLDLTVRAAHAFILTQCVGSHHCAGYFRNDVFISSPTPPQLLDQKMAELAQEPEGWDDVVSNSSAVFGVCPLYLRI